MANRVTAWKRLSGAVFVLTLISLSFVYPAEAAERERVRGKVLDILTGEPLIGAGVLIRNTTTGTVTDLDGIYELDLANGDHYISVSYIGYKPATVFVSIDRSGIRASQAGDAGIDGSFVSYEDGLVTVLLASDDKVLENAVVTARKNLESLQALQNERLVVEEAADFATACEKTGLYDYECILLDIMLPDGNGLELLQRLKKDGKRDRVIIISAKDSIEDKVKGLDLGADDYLAKPFHIAELTARVKSLIRRNNNGSNAVTLGNVTLDNSTFRVEAGGTPIELNRKEFDILRYFMHRPNHMISKETLAEAVWGDNIDQADNFDFIYAQIKNLRKKLQQAGATIEIKAVYGFGYKLVEL